MTVSPNCPTGPLSPGGTGLIWRPLHCITGVWLLNSRGFHCTACFAPAYTHRGRIYGSKYAAALKRWLRCRLFFADKSSFLSEWTSGNPPSSLPCPLPLPFPFSLCLCIFLFLSSLSQHLSFFLSTFFSPFCFPAATSLHTYFSLLSLSFLESQCFFPSFFQLIVKRYKGNKYILSPPPHSPPSPNPSQLVVFTELQVNQRAVSFALESCTYGSATEYLGGGGEQRGHLPGHYCS